MVADSGLIPRDTTADMDGLQPRDFSQGVKKSTPLRVLVVDDEALIRWSLSEALGDCGFTVIEAGDAQGAIRTVREQAQRIDVVLLDYRLPDSNDLGLLASLRAMTPYSQVILMTAYGTPEVARGALELGAFRVISKPFELRDMAGMVLLAHSQRPS